MNQSTAEAILTSVLPPERLGSDEDRAGFAVDQMTPDAIVFPESIPEIQAAVRATAGANLALLPTGRGSHLGIGMPPRRLDCAISTARLGGVVDHAAADMTLTVEAGTTLTQLDATVAASGQWLPVDPPLPDATTVGGLIAANLTGPLRLSQGGVRDLVLGLRVVRIDGTLIASGGRVVKNAAGYALHRAFIGSYGTLGVVVEVTFKMRPRPEKTAVVLARCDSPDRGTQLVHALRKTHMEPLWITMASDAVIPGLNLRQSTPPNDNLTLAIGLGGFADSVEAQSKKVLELAQAAPVSEVLTVAEAGPTSSDTSPCTYQTVHAALRDFPARAEADAVCTVSLLPGDFRGFLGTMTQETKRREIDVRFVADPAVARLHLALSATGDTRDTSALSSMIRHLRGLAVRQRGHLVIRRASPEVKRIAGVWGDAGPTAFLMQRLKRAFDPGSLLSDGRFVGSI